MSERVVNEQPFVWESAALYLLFCIAGVVGMTRPRFMGEAADLLQMTAYLWPYPLFLTLLKPVQASLISLLVVDLTGLVLVVWTTRVIGARLVRLGARRWVLYVLGLGAWYLPLLLLQATAWGAAVALGMSVGE